MMPANAEMTFFFFPILDDDTEGFKTAEFDYIKFLLYVINYLQWSDLFMMPLGQ